MRSIINKLLLGTMTVASVACTGNYLDINSNPYQPGDLSADDYALGSAMNNLASCVVSSDVNTMFVYRLSVRWSVWRIFCR